MKHLTSLVILMLLASCQHNVRVADQDDVDQQEGTCVMSSKIPVEVITADENGELHPATFDVAIHSTTPVEPVDFLGPLDFASSAIRYKIGQDFSTKFAFETPGIQRVTAVLNNPFTRHDVKCTGKFDVRRFELHVSPLPASAALGEEVPFQLYLQGNDGDIRFSADATEGSIVKLDPITGKGSVRFETPGKNIIHFYADASLKERKDHSYRLKDQAGIDVALGKPLECQARLSTSHATADLHEGDRVEAVVFPASDPTLMVEVAGFDPGPDAYDLTISGNIVSWRYRNAGTFNVSGLCRDLATRRLGKIAVQPHRILASEPLTAKATPSTLKPYVGEPVTVRAKSTGGLGRTHISSINAPEQAGLQIVNSNEGHKWVVRFDPQTPVNLPVQVTVEMRDETDPTGECRPPHCVQVPLHIQVQDPS